MNFALRILFGVAVGAVALYLAALVLLYVWQERLIFHGDPTPTNFRYAFRAPFEERWLEAEGGRRIHALRFGPADGRASVVYLHGNAGNMESWGFVAQELFERLGATVWIPDYPGYGKSPGEVASENDLHLAAAAAFREAAAASGTRVVVFGRSIGTGAAVKLASENPIRALILESPYESLRRLAGEKVAWVPRFVLRYPLRSDLWAPSIRAPTLILHGTQDELIPVEHGRALARSFQPPARLREFARGGHNDLGDQPEYWPVLQAFIEEAIGSAAER